MDNWSKILITGGAGFVGSSLALRIKEAYPDSMIVCMDNLYRNGSIFNRRRIEEAGVEFVKKDIRDRTALKMPRFDLIIDAAAEPSVSGGKNGDSQYVIDTNLVGTLNILEAARQWQAAVLFISTSRIFPVETLRSIDLEEYSSRFEIARDQNLPGISQKGICEQFPIHGSRTLYGATKFAAEIMVHEYWAQFGVRTLIDRCSVLAGPWQMGRVDQGIVALWVAAHLYNMPVRYIGYGGKQVRDILHVDDFADLVLAQMAGDVPWEGQAYNIGGGVEGTVSLRELTELVREATGRFIEIPVDPNPREGDVPLFCTDSTLATETWGWCPGKSPGVIVEDTVEWIKLNENFLRTVFAGGRK